MPAPAKMVEQLGLHRLSQGAAGTEQSFVFMLLSVLDANAPGATFQNPAQEVLYLLRAFAGTPAYQRLEQMFNTINENYGRTH